MVVVLLICCLRLNDLINCTNATNVLVAEILTENGRAVGVRVSKGDEPIDIYADLIISNAGLVNTMNLLPKEVFDQSSKLFGVVFIL